MNATIENTNRITAADLAAAEAALRKSHQECDMTKCECAIDASGFVRCTPQIEAVAKAIAAARKGAAT